MKRSTKILAYSLSAMAFLSAMAIAQNPLPPPATTPLYNTAKQSLLEGKRVNVFGLGTFEVRATKEKMGRNPKTGEKIQIPAGRKVVFKAAKGLKDQM